MADSYAQTPTGLLFIANGMDPMLKWDGLTTQAETVGVPAPKAALALSGSGSGSIAGDYYGYLRFLDKDGNPSNLSPISTLYTAQGTTGSITGATNASPIVITSTAHGLTTGTSVKITKVGGNTSANNHWVITVLSTNTFSLDDSHGTADYDGGGSWISGISTITYTTSKAITGATNTSPIVITSAAHGLSTDAEVSISGVGGNTAANAGWIITKIDANSFSLNSSTGNGAYTSGGTWVDVIPAKVTKRQFLRNTDGQTTTFYVDVETSDLTSATFTSTKSDTTLQTQTAVPILDDDGVSIANRYTVPPNHKAVLAHHQDRMFAAAQYDYAWGSVKVTVGSKTVTGVGTDWTGALDARLLYVIGASRSYEIDSIDVTNQTLTLVDGYVDATDNFAKYAIRPASGDFRTIYYTEAGLPEAWPATNAISLQEDGDEITGLLVRGSFLYILERRHVYRFTFQTNPAKDGGIFLASKRGCINHRSWVLVAETVYMLDEQGVHAFTGGQENEPVSQPIQEIFRPGSDSPFRINWDAQTWFHAVHYVPQETIRWFVAMSGHCYPRHALAYNYRLKRWWIEEYRHPIGGSCSGRINGEAHVFLGSTAKKTLAFWKGALDGPDPGTGTTRGTATAASVVSLTDSAATFPANGVVGAPLVIVDGKGKRQIRQITAISGTVLSIKEPWLEVPDTTSIYQIGGIPWHWTSTWFAFAPGEEYMERKIEVNFKTLPHANIMNLRVRHDFSETPLLFQVTKAASLNNGVGITKDSGDIEIDLTKANGFVGQRLPGRKEFHMDGPRFVQLELDGATNQDAFSIYQLNLHEIGGK